MNMKILMSGLVLLNVFVASAWADDSRGWLTRRLPEIPLYLRPQVTLGYGTTTVAEGKSKPVLIQFGIGLTAAYRFSNMFAGFTSDFRNVNQYSDVAATGANYRGYRWNIFSPTFGYRLDQLTLMADLQFLGNYNFRNESQASGNNFYTYSTSYTRPIGFRLMGTHALSVLQGLEAGAMFEWLSFGGLSNSVTGSADLPSRKSMWQFGFVMTYLL